MSVADIEPLIEPDAEQMAAHLEHLFGGFLDGYQDGRIELAWITADPGGAKSRVDAATFGTDQIDDLVEQACRLNRQPNTNMYIGAALKKPNTAPFGRTSNDDFYALTCAYVDLDEEPAVLQAAGRICDHKPTMAIVTGTVPHARAQLWWRLEVPCRDPQRTEPLLRAMATTLEADTTVCNPGRIMRLAGSIAWPVKDGRKLELVCIKPMAEPGLPVYMIEHLELQYQPSPPPQDVRATPGQSPVRTGSLGLTGEVADGRETYMRDTVLACFIEWVGTNGAMPTVQELVDAVWPQYSANADLTRPGRGFNEVVAKCAYAVKRFESGKLPDLKTLEDVVAAWRPKQDAPQFGGNGQGKGGDHKINEPATPAPDFSATPYQWTEPMNIPARQWLYGTHLIRKFVSVTVAPGGIGKSSLVIAEALAMVTGKPILGQVVYEPLRVWLWNLEDPMDELTRRIQAACQHYGITPSDIGDRLFVDTGRDQSLCTVTDTPNGPQIVMPVADRLGAELREKAIDVLIVDPLVSSHQVSENDNRAIDMVAKEWGRAADEANCSVSLVHHTRKQNGETVDSESARGAKALVDASRDTRVLNRMSEDEGERAGVENHRLFFRAYSDKANLAPPCDSSIWYQLNSVDLANGDHVGVVSPWSWPNPLSGHTVDDLIRVQKAITAKGGRKDVRAEDWVGHVIGEALGLDTEEKHDVEKIKGCLKIWLASGALKVVEVRDEKRNKRKCVEVGEWAND